MGKGGGWEKCIGGLRFFRGFALKERNKLGEGVQIFGRSRFWGKKFSPLFFCSNFIL